MASAADTLKDIILKDPEQFNKLPEDTRKALLKSLGFTPKPTMIDKAKQLVTGEGLREFDYPDFDPRQLDPKFTGQGAYVPPDARQAFYNAGVTPQSKADILENYRPDIHQTMKTDKHGVPYVTVGDKQFYLNRPGASMQDARDVGATALAVLPAVSRAGPLTVEGTAAPKTLIQKGLTADSAIARASTATAVGAAGSVTQDLLAQQGGAKEPVSLSRAAVSGGLSAATMLAWPLIKAVGVEPFRKIFAGPTLTASGEFTTNALEVFRKAGIDPKSFDVAQRKQIAQMLRDATNPVEMATVLEARGLPVPVNLTKGQAGGDRAQQASEYQAREGLMGDAAKVRMQEFDDPNRAAVAQNVQQMREKISPSDALNTEYNIGVGKAQNELFQDRLAAQTKYKQLYADVDKFSDQQLAWVETPERFRQRLMNNVDVTENLDQMPRLKKVVDDFESKVMGMESGPIGAGGTTGSKAPSVNELFNWRKRLQAQINGATPNEQRILIGVKREFDGFMKDTVADGLVRGDPALVGMWKDAIKSRADYGRLFEGDDIVDRITALTKNGAELAVPPHEAANLIFGAEDAGFVGKWNIVRNMQTLKSRLTPESWNSLRGDTLMRLFGMSKDQMENVAAGSATLPSGQKFKTALDAFRTKNPELFKVMFNDEESSLMRKVANVWQRVTVPKQGATNPSGSGLWAIQATQRAFNGPIGQMMKEAIAFWHPMSKLVLKPIKGSMKAGADTGYGAGYSPQTKILAPPPPMVSPAAGLLEQRLLDRYGEKE